MSNELATILHDTALKQIEDKRKDSEVHQVRSDEAKDPMIYASDLGHCPLFLYNKLCGLLDKRNSFSSVAFLEDGLLHEQGVREQLVKAGVDVLPPEATAIRYKVTGTNITISGRPDILIAQDKALSGILEVKAVKEDTYQRYNAAPSTIPPWYWHQLAYYMFILQAKEGMLVIKNRNTSEWLPDFLSFDSLVSATHTTEWANKLIGEDALLLKNLAEGKKPNELECMLEATSRNECQYCAARKRCYPVDSSEDKIEKIAPLDLSLEDDPKSPMLETLRTNLKEVIRLTKEVDAVGAELDNRRDAVQTALQELGKLKVLVNTGSASIVAGSTRTYPDGAVVKKLIASGVIPTKASVQPPRLMVRPKKDE